MCGGKPCGSAKGLFEGWRARCDGGVESTGREDPGYLGAGNGVPNDGERCWSEFPIDG